MKFRDILRYIPKAHSNPCSQCKRFTIDWPPTGLKDYPSASAGGEIYTSLEVLWSRKDEFPELTVLKSASDNGCTLCGALRSFLLGSEVGDVGTAGTTVEIRAILPNVSTLNFRPSSLKFEFKLDTQGIETWKQLTFVLAAPAGSPATRQFQSIRRDDPLKNTAMIQSWFKECEKKHVHCHGPTLRALPTRLIDVRSSDPKLVPTVGKNGKYAALSHCWGLSVNNPIEAQYLLKESNIDSLMQKMPFEDLPRNFQDAVTATRLVGIDYLWIDSVCIIQDSPDDKAKEIGGMVDVYGNAWVTICATSAPNSHAGFFGPRDSISEPVVIMPFVAQGFMHFPLFINGTYNLYIRKPHEHIAGDWSSDVETSDWNRRGWTYQERLVSRRMLHFAKNGVYFECLSSDFSEAGNTPREAVFESITGRGPDYRHLGFFEYFSSQSPMDLPRVYETYYWFVNEYSQRRLSFGGDREAAFSALVSQFKRLLKSEHAHGLWLDDIYRGLLWRPIDQTKVRDSNHSNKPALFPNWPSWSWYSSVFRSTWSRSHLWVMPLKLLPPKKEDIEIIYSENDDEPTKLRIRTTLIQVEMPLKPKELTLHPESTRIYPMSQFATIKLNNCDCGTAWFDESDAEKHIFDGKGFLLQIGQRDFGVSAAHFKGSASGIVVSPAGKRGHYRRVGYFEVDTVGYWHALFDGQAASMVTLV